MNLPLIYLTVRVEVFFVVVFSPLWTEKLMVTCFKAWVRVEQTQLHINITYINSV